jgi:hypothetical protein
MGNECKKVERMNKRQRSSVQVARGGGIWSVLRDKGRRASRVVETDRVVYNKAGGRFYVWPARTQKLNGSKS